ncbi:MAG: peptidoglycan-associated lipoprotein [Ferruginibacter sp.]|uniref:OmpA family protein n=1 Tax=Ferruginibacter sp. TaxID=1940288 RepID=UPI00265A1772|nr:OmpA family protein [Ferruginibacter sp.]MDB5278447.1 peptidoglycan-associated lipoprotein [Ferruginibacter sp.]
MTKKLLSLTTLLIGSFSSLWAQSFSGINTGNYAGVTGVMLQPASIVDSRYKFDINLISSGVNYSNNYFLVDRSAILKFNKNNFSDYQSFKANYLSVRNLSAGEKVFFNINNRTQVPLSFMATLGKKSAIALNIQSRSKIQGRGISGDLANMAYNGFYYPPLNNTPIDASGIAIQSLNWVEVGLTYGRVLYSSNKHFIKAAFTAKYLAGVASLNMSTNDFRISVNNDSSINFNTSNFNYNHNKNADFDMVFDKSFRPDATSFGFDAGLVYEYRGNLDKFKYIRNDDEKSYEAERRDVNKYIFKLGVSLLDAGMFKFDKPDNVNSFSANVANWSIANAHYKTIKAFDTALAARVNANANDPRTYNVYLPAALSVQLDIKFVKGLYLNAMLYHPVKLGSSAGSRFDNYGFYTITPRWESRHFGVYFPYTITEKNASTSYRQNTLGATLRAGPLFVGSSNLGTMAFNKNLSSADIFIGLKVGITYGKPNKASTYFQKIFARKHSTDTVAQTPVYYQNRDTVFVQKNDTSRLLIDYNKGKIYDLPNVKGNIIIVNNNYYYNSLPGAVNNPAAQTLVADTLLSNNRIDWRRDSVMQQQNKRIADSIKRLQTDSLQLKKQQLDSLIKDMQLLQIQMDSIKRTDSLHGYNPANKKLMNQLDSQALANKRAMDSAVQLMKTDYAAGKRSADSLLILDSLLKKKRLANNPGREVIADTRLSDQLALNNEKQLQQQSAIAADERDYRRRQLRQQDDLLRRYMDESASLKGDIRRLQRSVNSSDREYRNGNTVLPVVIPASKTQQLVAAPASVIRDTVYVKDTIRIRDTLTLAKKEILNPVVAPAPVVTPIAKEPVAKEPAFDYTAMPADIILFGLGKADVQPVYHSRLDYIAGILIKQPNLQAAITGHTDKSGSPEVNKALSLKRAQHVAAYLIDRGVPPSSLVTSAVSFLDPAVMGSSKSASSQNRRVVIKIINK